MTEAESKNVAKAQSTRTHPLPGLRNEMEQLFSRRWPSLFDWPSFGDLLEAEGPKVNVVDRESDIVVMAEVPGFEKDQIDVSVTDSTVTIRASAAEESSKEEDGDYLLREVSRRSVARTLRLPTEVDGERAEASYKNGMLEVTVPKVPQAKRRKIEIKSAE